MNEYKRVSCERIASDAWSKLRDERAGSVKGYSAKSNEKAICLNDKRNGESTAVIKKNVVFSTLVLPKKALDVQVTREQFWNDVERVKKSKHAQLETEFDVIFQYGLSASDRIHLVDLYCQNLADRYNVFVDVSIHKPHTHL